VCATPWNKVRRGEHVRFVIDIERHRARLQKKLARLGAAE